MARVNSAEPDFIGLRFVGSGYSSRPEGILIGRPFTDGGNIYRRVYRPPSLKPNSRYSIKGIQANYVTEQYIVEI